jgi:hypothetical protein
MRVSNSKLNISQIITDSAQQQRDQIVTARVKEWKTNKYSAKKMLKL